MTGDTPGRDPYESVLADLKAKRDQIDQAIRLLESVRSGASTGAAEVPGMVEPDNPAGMFLGMSIPDATKKLLAARRRALGNADIATALQAGGLVMNSANPQNTIGSVLTRRFNDVGDIVRVARGVWGLAEWYPNRSFKKKGEENGGSGAPAEC